MPSKNYAKYLAEAAEYGFTTELAEQALAEVKDEMAQPGSNFVHDMYTAAITRLNAGGRGTDQQRADAARILGMRGMDASEEVVDVIAGMLGKTGLTVGPNGEAVRGGTATAGSGGPIDPAGAINYAFGGLVVPGRSYHSALPAELEPWYCFTVDGGHSIAVCLTGQPPVDVDGLVPAPVKAVLRVGWQMVDGFVVADLPYGPGLGLHTDPADVEFGDVSPAPDPVSGLLGQVVMTGWIGSDPDGQDIAYLYLTAGEQGSLGLSAEQAMPQAAEALGLDPAPGTVSLNFPASSLYLTFTEDGRAVCICRTAST